MSSLLLLCAQSVLLASAPQSEASTTGAVSTRPVAPTPRAVVAVIVGDNRSPKPGFARLNHADDDAIKFYELFSQLGDAQVLTVLDDESQMLFAGMAAQAQLPSRAGLRRALARAFASLRASAEGGAQTDFYFVFSGHGDVGPGLQGFLYLGDEKISRSELFAWVVAASPADYNHLIIDSCNAYFMVKRRGDYADDEVAADVSGVVGSFLAQSDLSAYPNTGVFVATNTTAEAHEWSLFNGGVFSHELRSGLLGAADLNVDGQVSYDELSAYLSAANSRVDNPKAKIHTYAEAPACNRAAPILRYPADGGEGAIVQLDAVEEGRYYIEDGRGARYADFNKSAEGPLQIWLLPGERYYLRDSHSEVRIDSQGGPVPLASLTRRPLVDSAVLARGAIDDSFRRGLYALPFSRSYFEGFREQSEKARLSAAAQPLVSARPRSQPGIVARPEPAAFRWMPALGWSSLTLGGLGLIGGGVMVKLTLDTTGAFNGAGTLDDKLRLQDTLYWQNQATTALFVLGGVAAASGAAILFADAAWAHE